MEHGNKVQNLNPSSASACENTTGASVEDASRQTKHLEVEVNTNSKGEEPLDSIEFESKEAAFSYYRDYAMSAGFTAIIKASRRSKTSGKFIDAKFCCSRFGKKPDSTTEATQETASTSENMIQRKRGRINRSGSKTDCKASMHVKRRLDGKWTIFSFSKEHNHEIFPCQTDLARSDSNSLLEVQARGRSKIVSVVREFGGYGKALTQKVRSTDQEVDDPHLSLDEGNARAILDHFSDMQDKDPSFFYAINLTRGKRLKNVLWVEGKARLDYEYFGDVVFFDTMYMKSDCRFPFAPFFGVNHHNQQLLLGSALVADESKSTYLWLIRSWLKAVGGRPPRVFLTDQDSVLKEAVAEILPDSRHCFCLWHVLGKVPEKLYKVVRQNENFMKKFDKCSLKSDTTEQFEERWKKMVERFDLRDNQWFQTLYEDRHRWVPTYMTNVLLSGMSTKQRSDGISCLVDKIMQRRIPFKEFLIQQRTILQEKYEEEARLNIEMWKKLPMLKSPSPFEKQMAALYTHAILKKFQVEVLGVVACHPRKGSEVGSIRSFRVQDLEDDRDVLVVRDERTADISCSCKCFEFNGFLCRHAMIVLQMAGVNTVPSQYVLKRWTKDAKCRGLLVRQQRPACRAERYRDLCKEALKLGDEGSVSEESYDIAISALEQALKKCVNLRNSSRDLVLPDLGDHDWS